MKVHGMIGATLLRNSRSNVDNCCNKFICLTCAPIVDNIIIFFGCGNDCNIPLIIDEISLLASVKPGKGSNRGGNNKNTDSAPLNARDNDDVSFTSPMAIDVAPIYHNIFINEHTNGNE